MDMDKIFIQQTLELAEQAVRMGNEPFGAVLVKNNEVVATGMNHIHSEHDPTHHAELAIIREYCSNEKITDLSEYTMYTSCEPCCMCSGALVWSKLGKMVYSLSYTQLAEIAGSNIMLGSEEVFAKSPYRPVVEGGVLAEEAISIYKDYFKGSC